MIRAADFPDIPRLVQIMRAAHAEGEYASRSALDVGAAEALWARLIFAQHLSGAGGTLALVSLADDRIEGFMDATLARVYRVGDKLVAQGGYLYLTERAPPPDAMRALLLFIEWAARNDDVIDIQLSATASFSREGDWLRAETLYKRLGFEPAGAIYKRSVAR